MSTSSPTFTMPRSIRPVATVPRPSIENTSSIAIRNGLSTSRTGSGMYASIASISSLMHFDGCRIRRIVVGRLWRAANDRNLVAGEIVLRQQLANFQLDQLEQFRVVDQVDLVEEHDERRHADLASQQNVLAGLRHRAVGGRHDQDRAVHLGGAGDHVLDEVGVARAVDVGVVPLVGFVLDVRHGDGHGLGFVADRAALGDIGIGLEARQALGGLHRQDGARGGRLAVIDVTDRADVDVRLVTFEMYP